MHLLGPVEVRQADDGTAVSVGGPKERAVLAQLASERGRSVSVGALAAGLWGDDPPRTATKTLQTYVARLRRALDGLATIEWAGAGYRLVADTVDTDLCRVDELVRVARDSPPEIAAARLEEALAQWRGDPLADVADLPFAAPVAETLRERREDLAEDLVDAHLASGRHTALIGDLEAAVASHPLRERRWAQLLVALYRSGRQADALRAYQRARGVLVDELGLEPGAELRRLEAAIVAQDPELDWQPPTSSAPAGSPSSLRGITTQDLPTGTISLLLTDIEGSTRRWETDPEATAGLLTWHDEIMDETVRHHGGTLLKWKGEGDSTFSVFTDPCAAAAAAVEAQRRLRAHPEEPLPVRMAVHLGDVELRDGDYFGPTVNRAARLRGVAHGGQILVSDDVAAALRAQPLDGVSTRQLGVVRLKDVELPERVHQLEADGLPYEFRPLRSVDVGFTNIAPDTTSFVGREDDIAQVLALLDTGRLVTLTGAGGSGKTRLSQRVGRRLAAELDGGAWFVDLAPLVDGGQVAEATARALGVREEAGRPTIDLVAARLRDSDALVILDNCEHLVEASAELAATLLERCPDVRVLATSRERLRVPEETTWPVPPLVIDPGDVAGSEAVQLFVDRATAAQPSFRLTPDNEHHVAAICRAVDGIPLAIELAAARLRLMSPEQLANRLEDRFGVLTSGARTALPRQQTLRALVDWSHELLSHEEQVVFRRLSVFRGGFDLDAAEAVVTGPDLPGSAVLDLVSELADKSLLVVDAGEPPRMRILETLREYGQERLEEAGEVEDLARRHAERCAALADRGWEAFGPRHQEITAEVAREADNVRAALRWAIDRRDSELAGRIGGGLWGVWFTTDARGEADRWFREICTLPPPSDERARARLLVGAGNLAGSSYDVDRAVPLLEEGLELAERTEQHDFVVYALTGLANTGRVDVGVPFLRRAMEVATEHGSAAGVLPMVQLTYRPVDPGERRDAAEGAVDLARRSGDPYLMALALEALAHQVAGSERKALLSEALAVARTIGAANAIANMLITLAEMAATDGDIDAARSILEEAEGELSAVETGARLAGHLHEAAFVLLQAGDPDGALDTLGRSLAIAEGEHNDDGVATVHVTMAQVFLERDEPHEAIHHVSMALAHLPPWHEYLKVEAVRIAGVAAAAVGRHDEGQDLYAFAEAHLELLGPPPPMMETFADRTRAVADRQGLHRVEHAAAGRTMEDVLQQAAALLAGAV